MLAAIGAASVKVVKLSDAFRDGWDLADPLPEGVTDADVTQMLAQAMSLDTVSGWPDPDLSLLRRGRRPPPPLRLDVFGPWAEWIADAADGAGAPVDYVACPLLVAISTLIGNARCVRAWEGWSEPSVIWGGNIGDPSTNKSPGADPILSALHDAEKEVGAGFDEEHRQWLEKAEIARATLDVWKGRIADAAKAGRDAPVKPPGAEIPDEPIEPRIIVNDSTPEKLVPLMAANPRGLLHHRDELSGWLNSFCRYSSGDTRGFWLEAFGARPFTVDRVKAGSIRVPRLAISVFGGIQPDRLSTLLLKGDDDGLPSRFMWFWPDCQPPKRPTRSASPNFIRQAFTRLHSLHPKVENGEKVTLPIPLSHKAADTFQEWRQDHHARNGGVSGLLASAWGKMPGLVLRLALILELASWATTEDPEPASLDNRAILRAIAFVESYLKPMAARVYGDAAAPLAERNATTLARWIVATEPKLINVREIHRCAKLPGLRDVAAIEASIAVLEEGDWVKSSGAGTGGRPRKDYLVNPIVFSERA
jgi:hypothetical protein